MYKAWYSQYALYRVFDIVFSAFYNDTLPLFLAFLFRFLNTVWVKVFVSKQFFMVLKSKTSFQICNIIPGQARDRLVKEAGVSKH